MSASGPALSSAALVTGPLVTGLLVTGLLVAGCGWGAPPSTPSAPDSAATPTAGPARPLPARPRELRLDGIDACSVITTGLRTQLHVTSRMNRAPAGDGLRGSDCEWTNFPARPGFALFVRLALDRGIEGYSEQPGGRVTEVSGYAAVDLPGPYAARDDGCGVRVDVAAGQTLWTGYGSDDRVPGQTYDEMCDRVHVAAQSELAQLRARSR
jgi:hypothetical protein